MACRLQPLFETPTWLNHRGLNMDVKMISSILTVLDPYVQEQFAMRRSTEIAARTGARIVLAVCDNNQHFTKAMSESDGNNKSASSLPETVRDWLEEQAANVRNAGIEVESALTWDSPRFEAILRLANEVQADLIVKAASDHSIVERLLIGATDWELIRRAPAPLWMVKKNAPVVLRNWLVAVDPAHPDEKHIGLDTHLLETGASLAQPLGASLRLYHAYPAPAQAIAIGGVGNAFTTPPNHTPIDKQVYDEQMSALLELAEPHDIAKEFVYLRQGDTSAELVRLIDEENISLVIVGAVARGNLERLLIGSSAELFLNKVDCDLLVVKPPGFRASD
jgi:universal stress protein E